MLRKEKGITLVALVVTIVVLLILAGISLNLVLGQNGIITRAQQAKNNTEADSVQTNKDMQTMENTMTNLLLNVGIKD